MNSNQLKTEILNGVHDNILKDIYVDASLLATQKQRYVDAITKFEALYGTKEISVFSAPGRSEVGGNHTDHQHGKVLAAAINLDAIGIVAKKEGSIKILSDDFDIQAIDIHDVDKKIEEVGTSEALIRGVCHKLKELGYMIGGFEAFITSEVLMGAGLSSSAAFEVLIGTILSGLYNDMSIDPILIAQIGQYAENEYFEKPCGLMDQCASSVGSLININFENVKKPIVKKLNVAFDSFEHSLCIVDTKGSHVDLTCDYAAIPMEMKQVAAIFGKEVLTDVDECEFLEKIAYVREQVSDRCVLRAIHLFNENRRVDEEVKALEEGDFANFKEVLQASGRSSFMYLQNVYSNHDYEHQGMSIALAMSEQILGRYGACRVHGGGFAGTIQAFVENSYVHTYKTEIEKLFGIGSCHVLQIRKYGGMKVFA